MRIWIDTEVDSDVDDALAIAYALRHPALELVGISTVFPAHPITNGWPAARQAAPGRLRLLMRGHQRLTRRQYTS